MRRITVNSVLGMYECGSIDTMVERRVLCRVLLPWDGNGLEGMRRDGKRGDGEVVEEMKGQIGINGG